MRAESPRLLAINCWLLALVFFLLRFYYNTSSLSPFPFCGDASLCKLCLECCGGGVGSHCCIRYPTPCIR